MKVSINIPEAIMKQAATIASIQSPEAADMVIKCLKVQEVTVPDDIAEKMKIDESDMNQALLGIALFALAAASEEIEKGK